MTADTHSPIVLSGLTREAWLAERAKDITSTEIAAVLGISPYSTAFEVWQRKASKIDDSFTDSERARWGRRLEPAIAQGLAEDYGFDARSLKGVYMRHPTVPRMGASFDFEIADRARPELEWGLLEIKTSMPASSPATGSISATASARRRRTSKRKFSTSLP
jgi:putative phage-type endonuclease